ncbi:MAG: hypothetical protein MJE68_32855, partial [Proteobacteria bacterium]|nr:hypothetical protein [Pseudomonadota bacterium]
FPPYHRQTLETNPANHPQTPQPLPFMHTTYPLLVYMNEPLLRAFCADVACIPMAIPACRTEPLWHATSLNSFFH